MSKVYDACGKVGTLTFPTKDGAYSETFCVMLDGCEVTVLHNWQIVGGVVTSETFTDESGAAIILPATYVKVDCAQRVREVGCRSKYDREKQILCAPDDTKVILVTVWDDTAAPGTPPTVEAYNQDGTIYTGDISLLVSCPSVAGIEVKDLVACLAGVPVTGFAVVADSQTASPQVLSELWRDPTTGAWGPLPAGAVVGECTELPTYQIVPVCEFQVGTWIPTVVTTQSGNTVTVDSSTSSVSANDTFREVIVDFGNGHIETQTVTTPVTYAYPALADGEYQIVVYQKFASGSVRISQQLSVIFSGGVITNTVATTYTQTNPHGTPKAIQAVYDTATGLVVRYQLADGTAYVPTGAVNQTCPSIVTREIVQSDEAQLYEAPTVVQDVKVDPNGLNFASGALTTDYDPTGNGPIWTAPSRLQSFTVIVRKAGNTPGSANVVLVGLPSGKYFLTQGNTRTWSVAQEASGNEFLTEGHTVEAVGDAAFDVIWTVQP
jgi:hypothetical protein